MCGIIGIYNLQESAEVLRARALALAKLIRHRGPDWSGIFTDDNCILAHERLSIVDPQSGAQPLIDETTGNALAVNGEIYNHKELRATLKSAHPWKTHSDCEVLLYLYQERGVTFLNDLNGMFSFALFNKEKNELFVARDHIGIIPLYMGRDDKNQLYFASEMKALDKVCTHIEEFPPGHYLVATPEDPQGTLTKWYVRDWETTMPTTRVDLDRLKKELEDAVHRQLMCDVPYGVLVSGGLDSSVIAAIAAKYSHKRIESGDTEEAYFPRLHTFSVGLKGSPDLKFAQQVAKHIGSAHHEITFTIQEGLDAIREVIYHLETYDITSIRAATPMFLMSRKIKAMGIKMVLSGEGADEIFGGYLYFHKAPNAQEFHEETVRKLAALSKFDCCRANKATAAWGVEARVPFLDRAFVDYAMSIDPADKMCGVNGQGRMEKHIVREALKEYLPDSVLWRQKEQFSDGVGYSWIDMLKSQAEEQVSDVQLESASDIYPINPPQTKEGYVYRKIFAEYFTNPEAAKQVPGGKTIACSTAKAIEWDATFANSADPSGRAVGGVHDDALSGEKK